VESVRPEITVVYNDPFIGRFANLSEAKAVEDVVECVNAVSNALLESGYRVHRLPLLPPIESVRAQLKNIKTGLIFNLFEGFFSHPESEAEVANIFDDMGFVFTGCPPKSLLLALDKAESKNLLAVKDIAVPDYQILSGDTIYTFALDFPCIIKPIKQDASHGISESSVVYDFDSLDKQVKKTSSFFDSEVIVEKFLSGREFNICVIGNDEPMALPPSEIVYDLPAELPDILTFEAKWFPETTYYKGTIVECPAKIDEDLRININNMALTVFRIFECTGYARIDFRLDDSGILNVIELNPNPDISPDSGAARQAKAVGMSYARLIDKIALLAAERICA
jgi:D-alanine-D-alanine ligase